ncbi:hypothetical protein MHYP_G00288960 [Metynnis hypsauchen]
MSCPPGDVFLASARWSIPGSVQMPVVQFGAHSDSPPLSGCRTLDSRRGCSRVPFIASSTQGGSVGGFNLIASFLAHQIYFVLPWQTAPLFILLSEDEERGK